VEEETWAILVDLFRSGGFFLGNIMNIDRENVFIDIK
jgi:hypothetical protein